MAVQAMLKEKKLQAGSTVVLMTSLMGSISDNGSGGHFNAISTPF